VLAALPVTVTEDDLRAWIPKEIREAYPLVLPDLAQHGLEVVKAVHDSIYSIRGDANRICKRHDADLAQMRETLAAQRKALPVPEGTPTLGEALAAQAEADEAYRLASEQARAARTLHERTEATRTQIAQLRLQVTAYQEQAWRIAVPDVDQLDADLAESDRTISALEASLTDARELRGKRFEAKLQALGARERKEREEKLAEQTKQRADELEAAITGAVESAPDAAVVERLGQRTGEVGAVVDAARRAEGYANAQAVIDTAQVAAKAASDRAGLLTTVVDRLAKEAPAQLLARSKGIEGLGVDGDSITLNDVAMDSLSGREQIVFAVQVCRRLNEKARILICDGLERLDPEQYEVFVHEATHGGWQLIGTRVDRGDVVMEAISQEGVGG
jgi:hypothetical protein